ncbi:Protein PIEZO2 [Tupaia chinensis]|uniref:Protein PIEZO2 n=1 Tax=Tupaia chinensis TaxID=246437 RepID=L9L8F7_TUPCH|nr:Protein PIEZO2 [Tupaia chinensis]
MATEVLSGLLFRVLLPCCLLSGITQRFLRAIWCTGILFLLLQGALQAAFHSTPPNGTVVEKVLEHLGIIRLSRADAGNVLRLLAPDIGMALLGLVISTLSHKLVRPPGNMASSCSNTLGHGAQEVGGEEEEDAKTRDSDSEDDVASSRSEDSAEPAAEATGTSRDCVPKVTAFVLGLKAAMEPFSSSMGKVLVTLLLGLAGMVVPSLPSAVYFGAFLGLGSWWACGQALSAMAFSMLCVFMAVFTAGHLTSLYLYQLPFLQNLVPPNDIYARLLGMTALTRTNRTEPWRLLLQPDSDWPEMVHPLILLLSYYTLVLLLPQWAPQSGVSGPRRVRSFLKGSGQELPAVHHEQRQGQSTGPDAPPPCGPERRITFPGPTGAPTESAVPGSGPSSVWVVGHLATRHSYVTAPIAMMVWSVTHTSWLGFILLLWACVIWMVRDRRHLALFSAPCLVLYADLLVLLTFVVGLRLSPDELFPGVPDWLLVDLDLMPYPRPCLHLCAKSLYTSVFWSLLRQKVLERRGLVAAEDQGQREDCGEASGLVWPGSTLLDTLGSFLKGLLAKYWIFVCTAMFFLVSFRGKVVAYKVIYVTLFLSWVALYQMHYESWRRILKPFWVVMVSYSMVVLVAVYTYQFQSMAGFFNKTLGLSEEGLGEVGLQRFDTAELFAETTLPAVFLLLCILQLHYFHEDFLETTSLQSAPGQRRDTPGRLGEVGLQRFDTAELFAETTLPAVFLLLCILQLHYFHEDFLETTSLQSAPGQRRDTPGSWTRRAVAADGRQPLRLHAYEETSDRDSTADKLTMGFLKLLELVKEAPGPLWGVLETHMVKLVSLVVIWLTLQEVSLMNSVFYVLWVVSLPCSTLRPYASCVSTAWACVVVFCKTVFQLQRAAPTTLSSSCLEVWQGNRTHPPAKLAGQSALHVQPADLARWLGFRKCDGVVLPCLQNQLAILALMTLEVTVSRHQRFCRLQTQLAEPPTGAVTDTITRAHLDHGLKRALQYFVNYGFYKFGLELCFVAALNAIGQRMDLYALVHAICLIYLLNLRRRKAIAEAWPRYCGFLISIMVLQYFLCLGLPPAFCRVDFLLLLVASLQWQVFVDENRASVRVLAGDNVEVGRQLRPEDLAQLSPVPNFIFCRSYLDLAKVAVFRYHFWFVLCLVFLTGTTRISIWGAGYLVAFGYFMLHGHRLLLRPVKFILKPLDRLIAYSVLVVAVKTALSVGACVYLEALLVSHCWLVHSLGLYCTVEGYRRAIPEDEPCEPPKKEAGILWDAVCFTFLLLQRRVFLSYYHLFVVADLEATEALAGRGAELLALSLREALERQSTARRLQTMARFSWLLGQVVLDDVTAALGTLSRERDSVAAALRVERWLSWAHQGLFSPRVCPYDELAQSDRFYGSLPRLVKLALALGRVATAQSELLCYLVIVLNHTLSASIFSMVLPILCFLWAMLSVPRPSKRFWTAAIYYTEVTVVVKYFSQFGFFPWTTKRYAGISGEKPFSLPNILGIEKRDGYALCDLLQLLALCSHRSALQVPWRATGPASFPTGDTRSWRTLETYCAIRCFFFNLTHPQASPVCDVYALTFLVEVLVFAIVLFGYWAFGKYSAADLAESLSEDKVPEAFLTMVLAQFGTMMVDRALYLRKTLVGKCVFQVLLVLGTHCWLFFILPGVTERRFHLNSVAQAWYLVKCVYFGLSAYQIKCGYPNRILGNFLTKNFNLLNLFLFKGFRMVPFLLELRAVADWVWTDTALSLSNWVCLEDLYANIFILKCWRESEKKYPQPPGQKKKKTVKYGVGGVLAFALVSLMWFPLVFMSLLKTVGGVTNQPLDVSVKVAINGYELLRLAGPVPPKDTRSWSMTRQLAPLCAHASAGQLPEAHPFPQTLFSMNAQQQNLVPFSDADYDQLIERYALHPPAMQFLVNYRPEDIVLAKVKSQASLLWGISPAHRAALVRELANASSVYATVSWAIRRNVSLVTNVEAAGQHTVYYTDAGTRERLVHMLTRARAEPVMLPGLIPKALRTTAGTEAKMAHRLDVAHSHRPQEVDQLAFFRNATVRLQRLRPMDVPESEGEGHPAAEWWMVQEWRPACDQNRGCGRDLELVIYNDKVSPQSLNFLAGYGIVGLYVSVVLVAAKFIREHFLGASRSLMQEELPCVDRLLRLCSSIFLVRELGAFELEQQLFAKLVFLYRSPETMIRWTRERPPASRRRPLLDPDSGAAAGPGEAILAS